MRLLNGMKPLHGRRWAARSCALLKVLAAVAAPALVAFEAGAQGFPSRELRLVIPFPAGGPTDVIGRIVAADMGQRMGQTVVVENRPGAVGGIAIDHVNKQAQDGYTLLMVGSPVVLNYQLTGRSFDLARDFTPIGLMFSQVGLLVINPQVPRWAGVTSLAQMIALARASAAPLNYASGGNGSIGHLALEKLKNMTGIQMQHISYKGSAPAINDLIAGHVPMMAADPVSAMPHVRAGKLRVIAVTSAQRFAALPEAPTLAEQGFGEISYSTWAGVVGPAGVPRDIADRLSAELKAAIAKPEVQERMRAASVDPTYLPPAEFAALVSRDFDTWGKVVRDNKITAN